MTIWPFTNPNKTVADYWFREESVLHAAGELTRLNSKLEEVYVYCQG